MRDFLFLRHGATDWNHTGRIQGQIQNVPLNEAGIKQSENAALLLSSEPLDLIVSSTLDRAAATARIIANKIGLPIVMDKRLVERNWGVAEGLTHEELKAADAETFFTSDGRQDWISGTRQPKNSETREEVAERASGALFDLLSRYKEQRILLVTHGAWLRALMTSLTGSDQIFPNGVPYVASETTAGWQVKTLASFASQI
jgi:broad specificity phosphatase PhoE